jgi:hypothetical protein
VLQPLIDPPESALLSIDHPAGMSVRVKSWLFSVAAGMVVVGATVEALGAGVPVVGLVEDLFDDDEQAVTDATRRTAPTASPTVILAIS